MKICSILVRYIVILKGDYVLTVPQGGTEINVDESELKICVEFAE